MRKLLLIFLAILIFVPASAFGSVASDFIVNSQPVYSVPPGTSKLLILDLTLPKTQNKLQSIKIQNAGTAEQIDISKLIVWQDGDSAGWDSDESEIGSISLSPFWDTVLSGNFPSGLQRIFITVNLASSVASGRTIKPKLALGAVVFSDPAITGPTDSDIIGFERTIVAGASSPSPPVAPLAGRAEVISATTIRWHFTDLSNNEFGFKILDANLDEVARKEEANLSYLDETGLIPDTEYSARRIIAFNDRGESSLNSVSIFPAARTLAEEKVKEAAEEETTEEVEEAIEENIKEEVEEKPSLFETIQTKIAEIQQKIDKLLEQLSELLSEQTATIWTAFQRFLSSFFGK